MPTNEQIVDDLTLLIELHEERVARGADHGARDLAESVLTMLSAAGWLAPEGATVEWGNGSDGHGFMYSMSSEVAARKNATITSTTTYPDGRVVERRRYVMSRLVTPWVEVPGE